GRAFLSDPGSLCVASDLLRTPLPHGAEDLALGLRSRAASLHAAFRLRRHLEEHHRLRRRARFRELYSAHRRSALLEGICLEPAHRGNLDTAAAAGRLPDRLWHGPRAA